VAKKPSKPNRIALAILASHSRLAVKELFFPLGQNVAGTEHEIHFPQRRRRLFDGEPVAPMRVIVDNLLEQNRKFRSSLALQTAQKLPQMLDPRNVGRGCRKRDSPRTRTTPEPTVVRLPFFFGRIPRPRSRSPLVLHKPFRKRMRLSPPIPDASSTYECVETHNHSRAILVALNASLAGKVAGRGRTRRTSARHLDTPESYWLRQSSAAPWLWKSLSSKSDP
jgi:hypothetical protein